MLRTNRVIINNITSRQTQIIPIVTNYQTRTIIAQTAPKSLPMKPGTPIPGLNFMSKEEPPASKDRSEYPDWINDLAAPLTTLAKLRKMPIEEATENDKKRYLKLTRRIKIKGDNIDAGLR